MILEHFDKNNPHHAYLIAGASAEILPEVFKFCEALNIKTSGNPDFYNIAMDSFKIDDAFRLRAMSSDKSFTSGKKAFVICANSISLDAQNVLLKMFEEPAADTHFFLIVPDINVLLKTLVSRFYFIRARQDLASLNADKFIAMNLPKRIEFIKELLAESENEEETNTESSRSKALKFLNSLEAVLHHNMSKTVFDTKIFEHIFKVREFLRMPGSAPKMLLESVAVML